MTVILGCLMIMKVLLILIINLYLITMTHYNNSLLISVKNNLSSADIAKINRKYVCRDNRY